MIVFEQPHGYAQNQLTDFCDAPHHSPRMHDLNLTPDIYLDEALRFAPQTTCLIIPITLRMLRLFSHDPRLIRFLAAVRSSGARIVVGGFDASDANSLLPSDEVEVYPGGEDVLSLRGC